jgi:Ethanolamine utilization protein EutJ (predicted chaperonin)
MEAELGLAVVLPAQPLLLTPLAIASLPSRRARPAAAPHPGKTTA